ncbi:hypothetical protein BO86DRAFT_144820 [Aspergillus japonicus CBS 114.51]|uniref:Uncharacterized protein n=2 Tax=Aspergillus TaxID=5052 RepID=A0A2V5HMG6_ASPV1|nr:hypothetical protein BO86DRAFT_144820 [Aspergillus japonicus CBS 114.51]PYI23772.1 hypothetical protein BO99DRAFT_153306 [Aspergillus violaceofuscus CBS 115571]RAH79815.1 hypothetical protein BO86DRAFT_144820 [Aspergillus japonicus CBS 114.51]
MTVAMGLCPLSTVHCFVDRKLIVDKSDGWIQRPAIDKGQADDCAFDSTGHAIAWTHQVPLSLQGIGIGEMLTPYECDAIRKPIPEVPSSLKWNYSSS